MSSYHILMADTAGNTLTVVLHVSIPVGENAVNVPWNIALLNSGMGGKTVLPDGDGTRGTISPAEKAAIAAGNVYEHRLEWSSFPTEANAVRKARLEAHLLLLRQAVLDELNRRLNVFGFSGDLA